MDSFETLVKRVIKALSNTDYMFTGAIASSYYGFPRTTMDLDIIVALSSDDFPYLVKSLTNNGIELTESQLKRAFDTGYPIVSVDDTLSPYTLDLILLRGPLEKVPCTLFDTSTFIQTAEELVLSKLRMIKSTVDPEKSNKDKSDIKSILKFANVDMLVLSEKAEEQGTLDILDEFLV